MKDRSNSRQLGIADETLASLLEHDSDAILAIDSEHRVVVWNLAAVEMFGYSEIDMLGESLSRLLPEGVDAIHGDLVRGFAADHVDRRPMGSGKELRAV